MYDSCKDNPEVEEIPNAKLGDNDKRIEALEKKRRLRELYLMSFRLITGLSQDDYKNLLVIAGLLMKDKNLKVIGLNLMNGRTLFLKLLMRLSLMGQFF